MGLLPSKVLEKRTFLSTEATEKPLHSQLLTAVVHSPVVAMVSMYMYTVYMVEYSGDNLTISQSIFFQCFGSISNYCHETPMLCGFR